MAITAPPSPGSTPGSSPVTEKPDPAAATRKGGDTERPGFDLGGARDADAMQDAGGSLAGSGPMPGGSPDPAPAGTQAAQRAGATGMTDGTGRSPGGTAGGSKPGEAT
ncbi:MAG: hypothetical protein INR63_21780, partial [Actinomycetospora chiangmaiensis]|nr:hypothetical protein [Actinomycetospora chiangmaiensis]